MVVFNRRLIFWLIKAYIKRWGKIILISFLVGLGIFFLLKQFLFSALVTLTSQNKQTIGVVGAYTVNAIPVGIISQVSEGLTVLDDSGMPKPGLAASWTITDSGKTYTFILKRGIFFTDGTPFTAKEVNLKYSDVTVDRPEPYKLVVHLKENYAPFLTTVSKPILRNNFVGTGPYVLKSLKLNGSFLESLTLRTKDSTSTRIYQFYPTQDALKIAFSLGEISMATGLSNIDFQNTTFAKFPNAEITKSTRHDQLVTLFYNTQDKDLSDRKIRDAFSYAVPATFKDGERAYSPIAPNSWAYSPTNQHMQDYAHASVLLDAAGGTSNLPTFVIDTLPRYEAVAKQVQGALKKIGVKSKIAVVEGIPDNFQLFIGDFAVPSDPDQYSLWHSYQTNNITNFNSDKRIDKLLEDGRQTLDQSQRQQIYADFQKYLLDEQPATFLYFPYSYTVKRK